MSSTLSLLSCFLPGCYTTATEKVTGRLLSQELGKLSTGQRQEWVGPLFQLWGVPDRRAHLGCVQRQETTGARMLNTFDITGLWSEQNQPRECPALATAKGWLQDVLFLRCPFP